MTHLVMDILKACLSVKAKQINEHVGIADEVDLDLDTIGKVFGYKIHLLGDSHQESQSDGKEIFMRYKYGRLLFHLNPSKITKLPSGLNKMKGAKYRICDMVRLSDDESAMMLKNVAQIEEKYDVTFEIWEKKNLRLNKPVVKKIKSGDISVHHDTFTGILFLITDRKTYFRCNMNKCKKLYIYLLSKIKVQRVVKISSNSSFSVFGTFSIANFIGSTLTCGIESGTSKFRTICD